VFVIVATPFVLGRGYRFEVNMLGKAATWLLYLSLCLVMIVHRPWPLVIFWVGFGLAVVSLVLYARKARKEIGDGQGREHSQVEVDG
jgi:hypothetical protein